MESFRIKHFSNIITKLNVTHHNKLFLFFFVYSSCIVFLSFAVSPPAAAAIPCWAARCLFRLLRVECFLPQIWQVVWPKCEGKWFVRLCFAANCLWQSLHSYGVAFRLPGRGRYIFYQCIIFSLCIAIKTYFFSLLSDDIMDDRKMSV